jgi:hypothetical protein
MMFEASSFTSFRKRPRKASKAIGLSADDDGDRGIAIGLSVEVPQDVFGTGLIANAIFGFLDRKSVLSASLVCKTALEAGRTHATRAKVHAGFLAAHGGSAVERLLTLHRQSRRIEALTIDLGDSGARYAQGVRFVADYLRAAAAAGLFDSVHTCRVRGRFLKPAVGIVLPALAAALPLLSSDGPRAGEGAKLDLGGVCAATRWAAGVATGEHALAAEVAAFRCVTSLTLPPCHDDVNNTRLQLHAAMPHLRRLRHEGGIVNHIGLLRIQARSPSLRALEVLYAGPPDPWVPEALAAAPPPPPPAPGAASLMGPACGLDLRFGGGSVKDVDGGCGPDAEAARACRQWLHPHRRGIGRPFCPGRQPRLFASFTAQSWSEFRSNADLWRLASVGGAALDATPSGRRYQRPLFERTLAAASEVRGMAVSACAEALSAAGSELRGGAGLWSAWSAAPEQERPARMTLYVKHDLANYATRPLEPRPLARALDGCPAHTIVFSGSDLAWQDARFLMEALARAQLPRARHIVFAFDGPLSENPRAAAAKDVEDTQWLCALELSDALSAACASAGKCAVERQLAKLAFYVDLPDGVDATEIGAQAGYRSDVGGFKLRSLSFFSP